MRALARVRVTLAWILAATTVAVFAPASAPTAEAASVSTYTVTTAVNVRASKSANATILGQIATGKHVLATGKAKGGWLPIRFNAKTAYISSKLVKRDVKAASVVVTGPAGKKTSIMTVPIRTKAKVSAPATTTIAKGTVLEVSGETSGIYTKVAVDGIKGWASTRRLTSKTIAIPATVASYTTTAPLALRTSASASATSQKTIPVGTVVAGTGVHSAGFSQIVSAEVAGWVLTGYLKAVDGTPDAYLLPLAATTAYATVATPILSSASASASVVGTTAIGTALRGTGPTKAGFTAVIWNGTTAWVASTAVTVSLGSSSLDKLESNGKAAVIELRQQFPQLTTIYGWRASSAYSSDHPNGRAVDFMIPSYKTNVALGDAVAAYVIANGQRLHVTYLIWRQRNYTLTRGAWKAMEDRGSDTQNHMDHVHVSFEPSPK